MLVMVMSGGKAMQAVALALMAAGLQVVRVADVPMALRIVAQVPVALIVAGGTGAGLVPVCDRSGARLILVGGGGCEPGVLPYLLAALSEEHAPAMVADLARACAPQPTVAWTPVGADEGIPEWSDLVAELRAAVAQGNVALPQQTAVPTEPADFEEWEPIGALAPVAPMPEAPPPGPVSAPGRARRFAIVG